MPKTTTPTATMIASLVLKAEMELVGAGGGAMVLVGAGAAEVGFVSRAAIVMVVDRVSVAVAVAAAVEETCLTTIGAVSPIFFKRSSRSLR